MKNQQLSEFEELLDEDDYLMATAQEQVDFSMKDEPIELATAMMVALRDYISDYYEDENMGFKIAQEVAQGREGN